MTAADKYYLKAKDNYSFCLDETLEALEYGLACDNEHAGLLTLQGKIYCRDLEQYDAAREQFELALFYDPNFVVAYYEYLHLLSIVGDIKKAALLIEKAINVPGIDKSQLYYKEALMWEKLGQQTKSLEVMKHAIHYSSGKDCYTFLTEEVERLQTKNKETKLQNAKVNFILT